MLDKGKIINRCFDTLGVIKRYNDNSNNYRTKASSLFDSIILELSHNKGFSATQATVKPTLYKEEINDKGEYTFNKPFDYFNFIGSNDRFIKHEGEFIYSTIRDLEVTYNTTLILQQIPNNFLNYIRYALCVELSNTFRQYASRTSEFVQLLKIEEDKLKSNETPQTRSYLAENLGHGNNKNLYLTLPTRELMKL